MNAYELLDRVTTETYSGKDLDWRSIRKEIHTISARKIEMEERIVLLQIFYLLMNLLEDNAKLEGAHLEALRDARRKDRNILLIREAMIGEHASIEILDAITKREVQAGRMEESDELRQMAIEGMAEPHLTLVDLFDIEQKRLKKNKSWRRWFSKKDVVNE